MFGLPSGMFSSLLSTNSLSAFTFSILATYNAHLTFFDFMILIILGEECKLRSSWLRSFLQPPVTSSFLGPIIQHPLLNHPKSMLLPLCQRATFTLI
jgi:hypothetical protein